MSSPCLMPSILVPHRGLDEHSCIGSICPEYLCYYDPHVVDGGNDWMIYW